MIALARLVKALKAIATDIKEGLLTNRDLAFLIFLSTFLVLIIILLMVGVVS